MNKLEYLSQLHTRITQRQAKNKRVLNWLSGLYAAADADHMYTIPFSVIVFVAITLLLWLPWYLVAVLLGYWYLLMNTLVGGMPDRAFSLVATTCSWVKRFLSCAFMCVLIHLMIIYLGWEAVMVAFVQGGT